jgi:hypothetical protein
MDLKVLGKLFSDVRPLHDDVLVSSCPLAKISESSSLNLKMTSMEKRYNHMP